MFSAQGWGMKTSVRLPKLEGSTPQPPLKRPYHMLISHSKPKPKKNKIKNKNCMLPKVTCEIYATKTLVEGGANLVFCKNCDPEMFV